LKSATPRPTVAVYRYGALRYQTDCC